ncbi:hypothetical protein COO60DRAFT_1522859, partial [Scenedesmus sp. NREL 46B-D3]
AAAAPLQLVLLLLLLLPPPHPCTPPDPAGPDPLAAAAPAGAAGHPSSAVTAAASVAACRGVLRLLLLLLLRRARAVPPSPPHTAAAAAAAAAASAAGSRGVAPPPLRALLIAIGGGLKGPRSAPQPETGVVAALPHVWIGSRGTRRLSPAPPGASPAPSAAAAAGAGSCGGGRLPGRPAWLLRLLPLAAAGLRYAGMASTTASMQCMLSITWGCASLRHVLQRSRAAGQPGRRVAWRCVTSAMSHGLRQPAAAPSMNYAQDIPISSSSSSWARNPTATAIPAADGCTLNASTPATNHVFTHHCTPCNNSPQETIHTPFYPLQQTLCSHTQCKQSCPGTLQLLLN